MKTSAHSEDPAAYGGKFNPDQFSENEIVAQAIAILEKRMRRTGLILSTPETAGSYCRLKIGAERNEHFLMLCLSAKNELIDCITISIGSVDQTVVYPRSIVTEALRCNAVSVVFAHNHPSGNLQPSAHDIELTKTLKKALEPIGIRVCDHLIISGSDGYLSFHEKGIL